MRKTFSFQTEPEAVAFVDGVEYVNDSAIEVIEITKTNTDKKYPWLVTVEDYDAQDND